MILESIKQLREICQKTRNDEYYQDEWLSRKIIRRVSIYPTKFFLKAGLSPNKITLLGLLFGIAAGALFTFPQAGYWLLAWGLFFFYNILDCCDGEVARYCGLASLVGQYNDVVADNFFLYPFLRVCMCFGIYQSLGNIVVLILGFIQVLAWVVYWFSPVLCQAFLNREVAQQKGLEESRQVEPPPVLFRRILQYGQMLVNHTGFFFALLIISLLDMFVPSFSIGLLDLNVRFIYVALFSLAMVVGALLRVYDVNKYGVRLYG